MLLTTTIQAGATLEFYETGDFLRLIECNNPVTIRAYNLGAELVNAEGVSEGYAEKFSQQFTSIKITSATTQTLQFVVRLGNVVYYDAPPVGAALNGAFTQANATVTNASAQLKAQNLSRRYLFVQNNDASGDIYITLDGSGATTAKGIKIGANGGAYELQGYVPNAAINAIGTIANNANVVIVEG